MGKATTAVQAPAQPVYNVNAKRPYSPRAGTAQGNVTSWAALTAHLQANGPQTAGQLRAVLKARNHTPFVQYCIKRGWLTQA